MQATSDMLKRQDREGGKTRQWRSNFKRLQRELLQLEEDTEVLDSVFPQVCCTHRAMHHCKQQHGMQTRSTDGICLAAPCSPPCVYIVVRHVWAGSSSAKLLL